MNDPDSLSWQFFSITWSILWISWAFENTYQIDATAQNLITRKLRYAIPFSEKKWSDTTRRVLSYQRFLMPHSDLIDRIRTRVWLSEVRSLTQEKSIYSLAGLLDPESVWTDECGSPHHSKWYRYASGTTVPSQNLTSRIKSALPTQEFDIHHPAWSLLRKPDLSTRSIERLIHAMPTDWQDNLDRIKRQNYSLGPINGNLVSEYKLYRYSFLDSLFLFELARRHASHSNPPKAEALLFTLLSIPLIYIDDPIWTLQNIGQQISTCKTIEKSLRLDDSHMGGFHFPALHLVRAIHMQRTLLAHKTISSPRSVDSHKKRIFFLAHQLGDPSNDPYTIGASPYSNELMNSFFTNSISNILRPSRYSKEAWEWAWKLLETDPRYKPFHPIFKMSVLKT